MLIHLPHILQRDELLLAQRELNHAQWHSGSLTAGPQARQVKDNEQLPLNAPSTQRLQAMVLQAVRRDPLFFSAALPKKIHGPLFNRYAGNHNQYGAHIDDAVMHTRTLDSYVRSDVSCTLFLAEPQDYEGGELCIHDTYGTQAIKLAAGDMVLYPSTSLHEVKPVTSGARVASFFWVESMVRSDEQRRLLHELDMSLLKLRQEYGESAHAVALSGTYHNLLRMWADT
jgi:PKHD-type hydroxylase